MAERGSSPRIVRRVYLSRDHIAELTKEELVAKWHQQEAYLAQLESTTEELNRQVETLQSELKTKEAEIKKIQHSALKLSLRDRKIKDLRDKLDAIKNQQLRGLESTLVDPAVNVMFEKMRLEVEQSKAKVEEMQNELTAWKFTPDSATGKRLIAKCRALYEENEELGKEISSGWISQLHGNLALQKKFTEELKKSQVELDEFLLEIEDEVEGMQDTIYRLKRNVKAKRQLVDDEEEDYGEGCSSQLTQRQETTVSGPSDDSRQDNRGPMRKSPRKDSSSSS